MRASATALVALLAATLATRLARAQTEFGEGHWVIPDPSKEPINYGTQSTPLQRFAPYHVALYAPTTCESQCGVFASQGFPVLLFVTGFAGQLPVSDYDLSLQFLASQGIVVVAVDESIGLHVTENYPDLGSALAPVVAYIYDNATGLPNDLRTLGTQGSLWLPGNQIFVGGHSSGCHIALEYVQLLGLNTLQCGSVAGAILWSPLDGEDPLGFGSQYLVSPTGGTLSFQTPGLIVSGSLDSVPGEVAGAACAPVDQGAAHFYNAWNHDAVFWVEAVGVGHLDLLDPGVTTPYDGFCATANNSELQTTYREAVQGLTVAFMEGVVTQKSSYFSIITNTLYGLPLTNPQISTQNTINSAAGCAWAPVGQGVSYEIQLGLILFGAMYAVVFLAGLYCFFRRMDDDTLGRYVIANEPIGVDHPKSFQTALAPNMITGTGTSLGPSVSQQLYHPGYTPSASYQQSGSQPHSAQYQAGGGASRVPSVQV